MNDLRGVVAGVSLVALATLFYEVLLTRIFSVTLWYHFGFLAVSMALLGTAASAVLCFLHPERLAGAGHAKVLCVSALLFALLAPCAVAFHISVALPSYENALGFYAVFGAQLTLLFLSFFASGLCISIALYRYAASVGTVYFFDLIGASLGSLTVVPLMYAWSAPALIFLVSAAACLAACSFAAALPRRPALQRLTAAAALGCIALGAFNDDLDLLRVRIVKSYQRDAIQRAEPASFFEKWSPISRVAVISPGGGFSPDEMLRVTNDAGAPTLMLAFDGDYSKIEHIKLDPTQAAHHLKQDADVLVIGSGGGIDVLTALAFGQASVTAVEINPVMGEVVSDYYADYIGRIFDDPRVRLHIQEGRNFVAGSEKLYDIIQFMMIDSWGGGAAGGAYVFSENSLYTSEAVGDYLAHLKPGGILAMTRYFQWSEGLRLTNLFADHLERHGSGSPEKRIVVIKKVKQTNKPLVTALLKNGEFTPDEVLGLLELTRRTGSQILYAPHLREELLPGKGASALYPLAVSPETRGMSREQFVEDYGFDISAPTDDRPFFFFTQRLSEAFRVDAREHAARRVAIPLLYGMLLAFGSIGLLTIFVPLYLRSGGEFVRARYRVRSIFYFAMLGAGFMLIEISLIQRLTIFLGHPTWSFVVVLTTLLFSSGLGSLFSARWPDGNPRVLCASLAALVVLLGFYATTVYDQFIVLMALPFSSRLALVVAVMAPAGFGMGMCFPMGVQIVRRFHEALVPWGWGVNGAFSVFASVLSIVLAIALGFKVTLALGVACYAVALAIVWTLARAEPREDSA